MTLDPDVLVVGAGPAGAAAAIHLTRAGRRVLVVDRARFPRDKVCGDGLTTGALRHLEGLGLDRTEVASWREVDEMRVVAPSGAVRPLPFPRGLGTFAAVARRVDLDAALVERARAEGAEVHDGHAVVDARVERGGVVAEVEGLGEVRAAHVIGADGTWSPLRRHLGLAVPGYRGDCHAFRQYLVGTGPTAEEALWVWFEEDLLPGYAWSFPLGDGTVNVGFGIHRNGRMAVGDMGDAWRSILRRPVVTRVLGDAWEAEGPPRAWPIPARVGRLPLASGPALFVGDAAAACDPMSGEGIGQALETAALAAAAITAGGGTDAVAARYERTVRAGLARDNRMAEWVLPLLRSRRGAEAAVRISGSTPWVRRNFARWLFEDYPRALVLTPRRWHRGAFTGPGAWVTPGVGGKPLPVAPRRPTRPT